MVAFLKFFRFVTVLISILIPVSTINTIEDHMCLSFIVNVCFMCSKTQIDGGQCMKLNDEMNTIVVSGHKVKIDYKSYINSHIKIIEEDTKVTLYSCDIFNAYTRYYKRTYYPIGRELRYPKYNLPPYLNNVDKSFQRCIKTYCLTNMNMNYFECLRQDVKDFDFVMDSQKVLTCVQNITMAYISTSNLTRLHLNTFFQYAYNLIYLQLDLQNLRYVSCNIFKTLSNLRLLDFGYNNFPRDHYECVFKHSENLIKIDAKDVTVWNKCDLFSRTPAIVEYEMNTLSSIRAEQMTTVIYSQTATEVIPIENDQTNSKSSSYYFFGISVFITCLLLSINIYLFGKAWIVRQWRDARRRHRCQEAIRMAHL